MIPTAQYVNGSMDEEYLNGAIPHEEILTDLKERVNKLLWIVLPKQTTLGEAEELAIQIFNMIESQWGLKYSDSLTSR